MQLMYSIIIIDHVYKPLELKIRVDRGTVRVKCLTQERNIQCSAPCQGYNLVGSLKHASLTGF